MKRAGAILSLVALIVVFSTSLCFAGTLTLEKTYPEDGSKGASIENLGVKLYFSSNLTSNVAEVNKDVFALYDAEGKKLPTKVLYPDKEDGVVLVLLDSTADANKDGKPDVVVQGNSEYKLTISKDLVDDKGNVLGTDQTVTFTTLNQNANMMVNMGMMVVMFGGMMVFSLKSAKKDGEEAAKREEKVNPYKEAKRTGKSVEEIVEKDQKEKAKKAAKEAAKAAKESEEWIDVNTYRVKSPRPISAGGGSYITGRKAAAEAKKAEEAARKAAKQNKARNVKKGKGKKKK